MTMRYQCNIFLMKNKHRSGLEPIYIWRPKFWHWRETALWKNTMTQSATSIVWVFVCGKCGIEGCCFIEFLNGIGCRLPYSNETDSEHLLIRRVCREGYRPVIKPELGGGTLPELIKKCWAPNPKDRPSMLDICKIAHAKLVELEKVRITLRNNCFLFPGWIRSPHSLLKFLLIMCSSCVCTVYIKIIVTV